MSDHPPRDGGDKPLPLQFELPAAVRASTPIPPPRLSSALPTAQPSRARLRKALGAAAAGMVAATALGFLVVVPWLVRRTCIDEAAAHGIELSVRDVVLEPAGFRLVSVGASMAALPGARATAPEVEVQTLGFRPQSMSAKSVDAQLTGSFTAIAAAFTEWRDSPQGGDEGRWGPSAFTLDGAHLTWNRLAEGASIDASDVHVEVVWRKAGAVTAHARSEHLMLLASGVAFGPWQLDLDRGSDSIRARIALDPGVPDAGTILVLGDGARLTSVDVKVPRSPLSHLGIPPSLVSELGPNAQGELSAHYALRSDNFAEVTAQGAFHGLRIPAGQKELAAEFRTSGSGDPHSGIDMTRSELVVGPFRGALKGTIRVFDDGLRIAAAWQAAPLPCEALAAALLSGTAGDLAEAATRLARSTGITMPTGTASARASVVFDTRNLDAASMTLVPELHCTSLPQLW